MISAKTHQSRLIMQQTNMPPRLYSNVSCVAMNSDGSIDSSLWKMPQVPTDVNKKFYAEGTFLHPNNKQFEEQSTKSSLRFPDMLKRHP